ncbi:seminal metalloprotease 1-like isoform X2 [Zeugodacus cucurbitae]|uniref:seminal metalloprotease 1-like isoform X2 n=1 Tax=Zeugodacus cucurbitae TaxID=28588 RepID=UPI0023D8F418|nr:seminal metalloprotease 1-like isoform X2 [Zeugodacus cucurbitae]
MMIFLGFLLLFVIARSRTLPGDPRLEDDPELTPGFFEGDIALDVSQRNGVRKKSRHWPNDKEQVLLIKCAMKYIQDVSCIRFIKAADNQPYFLNITGTQRGCHSKVGFTGRVQRFNLKPYPLEKGCFRFGSIVHEMMHALGFYHMQNTYNRDEYVYIAKENIKEGHFHNFKRYDKKHIEDFESEYDYASIMHYKKYAFTKNGKDTIVPLKKEAKGVMGQRVGLTKCDIGKLNKMYKCGKN